jgi:DNA-binding response OmpR family regulator
MTEQKKDIILIIDDEPDLREMIQYQFQAKGFEVVTAENGIEALKKLKHIKPDLIVLDINMPKMGGLEFYQAICDQNARPRYPVLVLTARANLEQLFKDFDIHGFMSKPFDVGELIKQGAMIIEKTKSKSVRPPDSDNKGPKTVCVVENNTDVLKHISAMLKQSGYIVDGTRSGTLAIEKIMVSTPDVVLIQLGLADIAGDIVAFRLKRMAMTCDVKVILYVHKTDELNVNIVHQIGEKGNVATIVNYTNYNDLLKAVNKVLEK